MMLPLSLDVITIAVVDDAIDASDFAYSYSPMFSLIAAIRAADTLLIRHATLYYAMLLTRLPLLIDEPSLR